MITVPTTFQSSKGDGSISRTIKGAAGVIVFVAASQTPLSESEVAAIVNQMLVFVAAGYTLYGLVLKAYNKVTGDNQ